MTDPGPNPTTVDLCRLVRAFRHALAEWIKPPPASQSDYALARGDR